LVGTAIPLHREAFLTLLGMFGQRSVRESKTLDGAILVDDVYYFAKVERPQAKMLDDDCHGFLRTNWRIRPAELDTWDIEHPPAT